MQKNMSPDCEVDFYRVTALTGAIYPSAVTFSAQISAVGWGQFIGILEGSNGATRFCFEKNW